jgi:hypothetical protein
MIGFSVVLLLLGAAPPALARDSVGVVDQDGEWRLADPVGGGRLSFIYGNPADVPFAGDWDCDGIATPGLYRRSTGQAFLRNSNSTGLADVTFMFGNPGDIPLAGDFDGNGCDSLSIYRPGDSSVHIVNRLGRDGGGLGPADQSYVFGNPGDVPFAGDWDGDGTDTVALRRPSDGFVYMTDRHARGAAETSYLYGDPGDIPFAGDWDGDGADSVGLHGPGTVTTYLRNSNTTGIADMTVRGAGHPVAGDFGALPQPPPGPARVVSMVPREGWGARPADTGRMIPHTITRLTVHHAGTQRTTTGPPQYRGWQDWHMIGQGWPDLAYHVIIGVDGAVYEGRDPAFRGDTGTTYDTTGHFLVVVEGDFEVDHPTPAQLDALTAVLAWAAEHYGVSSATITGHGDHAATLCPGAHLESYITSGELRSKVETLIDDGGVGLDWP